MRFIRKNGRIIPLKDSSYQYESPAHAAGSGAAGFGALKLAWNAARMPRAVIISPKLSKESGLNFVQHMRLQRNIANKFLSKGVGKAAIGGAIFGAAVQAMKNSVHGPKKKEK